MVGIAARPLSRLRHDADQIVNAITQAGDVLRRRFAQRVHVTPPSGLVTPDLLAARGLLPRELANDGARLPLASIIFLVGQAVGRGRGSLPRAIARSPSGRGSARPATPPRLADVALRAPRKSDRR